MKSNSLLLLPLGVFLLGATWLPQGDKPAEEVFKNIVSFKGEPARDVLPAMKFMAAALKVKCSFCHDPKGFSSDDKDEKKTARKMIEMQRSLNKQFFEGRNQVTCMSCHNGHNQPTRTPSLAGLTTRHQKYTGTLTATDLFKKYQDAVGGELKSVLLTGTTKDEAGQPEPYEILQASPNRFLITEGNLKIGYDGTATWHAIGGRTNVLWGDNAVSVQRMGRFFRGPKAFDSYSQPTISGKEMVDGKSAIVVRATVASDKLVEELYFDEATGLLLREATITQSTLGSVLSFIDFSDYRDVSGVKVPFKVVSTSPEGATGEVDISTAKANVTMDESVFSPAKAKS